MDCFAIHLFFPSSNRREAEKGCKEQVPCWVWDKAPSFFPPSMDCIAIHPPPLSSNRREAKKGCREQCSLLGYGSKPHHSPSMDCIAIHPSPTFFKPPRSGDGSLRDNRPSGGVWGGSPIVPPRPPVPRPRHSMRTFRPSIIAARALRENASNCLSVMCSIRLSGFTEPAAVVLAVGTP